MKNPLNLIKTFKDAINGLVSAFRSERNIRLHTLALILVASLGIYVRLSAIEWCIIIICSGVVIGAELLNTAIEKLVDLVHPGFDERAGKVKDIAAAAVLVCAIAAAVTGCLIFLPKLFTL